MNAVHVQCVCACADRDDSRQDIVRYVIIGFGRESTHAHAVRHLAGDMCTPHTCAWTLRSKRSRTHGRCNHTSAYVPVRKHLTEQQLLHMGGGREGHCGSTRSNICPPFLRMRNHCPGLKASIGPHSMAEGVGHAMARGAQPKTLMQMGDPPTVAPALWPNRRWDRCATGCASQRGFGVGYCRLGHAAVAREPSAGPARVARAHLLATRIEKPIFLKPH